MLPEEEEKLLKNRFLQQRRKRSRRPSPRIRDSKKREER